MFNRVSIIGLGLIGGSLGINIRRHQIAEEVVGMDIDPKVLKKAIDKKVIDCAENTLEAACSGADCIILAVPPNQVEDSIAQVSKCLSKPTIVTDVTSFKRSVIRSVETLDNPKMLFVGGHPIAGTEAGGILGALEASRDGHNLFKERVCILTPYKQTDGTSLNKVRRMWELLGSAVYLMSPERHDEVVAMISHLPHLVVYTMLHCIAQKRVDLGDIKQFAGGGFKDTTRIGASDPKMWVDILLANRDQVLNACKSFGDELAFLQSKIEARDEAALLEHFSTARDLRRRC